MCAGDPKDRVYTNTTHCIIVFVALSSASQPTEVPRWVPETAEDITLEQYAIKLMELRKSIEAEMRTHMQA
jgi:acyl-CoA hydrolase